MSMSTKKKNCDFCDKRVPATVLLEYLGRRFNGGPERKCHAACAYHEDSAQWRAILNLKLPEAQIVRVDSAPTAVTP
jgi:hypothetical protein